MLDAPLVVISMRRQAEGLFERPAEIVPAQANELCERGEWYLFGQMLLDVGGDDPLLPGGETAARGNALGPGIEAHELVGEHHTSASK